MAGYVIDPFTNAGYQTPVTFVPNGGLPTVPDGALTRTEYSVTKAGGIFSGLNPFTGFMQANVIAQAQRSGLDADNNNWGVQAVQVAVPVQQVAP